MKQRTNDSEAAPDAYRPMGGVKAYLDRWARRLRSNPIWALGLFMTSTLIAQETVTPLMSHALSEVPGKEVLMYTVEFPAGFSSSIHRHDAQVYLYVLEGSVVMQVRGGKELTLTPGQSFYENPNDIHVVSRNASSTKPAKFLVFLIHKKDAPLVIPAK